MNIIDQDGTLRFMNYAKMEHKLAPGNYSLSLDQHGYFLSRTPDFSLPKKIYGNLEQDVDFYADAFLRGDKNLGVILNGEKGSGKTLLASLIAHKLGIPVIIIGTPYQGQVFVNFINEINQPSIVLIDEYDKLYKEVYKYDDDTGLDEKEQADQTALLKLMDSANSSKKFFILTSNKQTISEYMINRPSRIRYKQVFGHLTEAEIKEIVNDKLDKKYSEYASEFQELAIMFFGFNLDTLMTVIDETNRYGKSPKILIKRMNIIPEANSFEFTLQDTDGKIYKSKTPIDFDPVNEKFLPRVTLECIESTERTDKQIADLKKYGHDDEYCSRTYYPIKSLSDPTIQNYTISHDTRGIIYTHNKDNYSVILKKFHYHQYAF